ncbi:hypothetical protein F3Y22_tig00110840pilonHSYRG00109 [Hibiscus syriacus]|uniref:Reverse transcriptase zinc-binding domain-containing protein n=1 Tax=Hibiscus syriacus TaxID=106335 RepID=A0A6A2ZKY0_HIBSY|nr:hypothetical protein F3Y22_tig00110840pilonHSYRG00109 [Hibiscus syriacus]
MERLGHLIQKAVDNGTWKPIKSAKIASRSRTCSSLMTCSYLEGLARNRQPCSKMSLIFSVQHPVQRQIPWVPLIHGRVSKLTYRELVDKVKLRLSNWKAKVISAMGISVLVSSVTSVVPTYTMMTSRLPIVNEINRLNGSLRFGLQGLACGHLHRIGNGTETLFSQDNWLGHPLVLNPAIRAEFIVDSRKVSEFITSSMEWDSNKVFAMLPMEIASQIIGYPLPKLSSMKDGYVWKYMANGQFSTRSAYLSLIVENYGDLGLKFSWIWDLSIIPKWKYFIWLAWRDILLTNVRRASGVSQVWLVALLVDAIRRL